VTLDPRYAIAFYNRGNAYYAKGDPDRAIRDYDPALALDSKYQDALVNRGVAHERKGWLDQAIRDYDEAVGLDPKDPVALNNRGNALLKKGQSVAPSPTTISRSASTTSRPVPILAAPSHWRAGGSTSPPSPTTIM
jgi:tetratricopeptide (TPR) repeat protein